MARLSLGPLIEPGGVHDNLTVGRCVHMRAVHWPRRGSFEVHAFAVVAAAVARALELVLAGLPVRRASQMGAAGINHENAIGSTMDPDAVFLLPLGVDAERVIGGISDLEDGGRLEQRTRQAKTQEGDKPGAQERCD